MENKDFIPSIPGGLPHLPDNRDIPLSAFQPITAIPPSYFTDISSLPVNNQNQIGSCVGQASSVLKEQQEVDEHVHFINLAARWIYAQCKKIDNYSGQGTYVQTALKVLQDMGVCYEYQFPNDGIISDHAKYIDLSEANYDASETASHAKIKSYAFVSPLTWDGIKQAIYNNKTIVLAMAGSNDGWRQQPILPPNPVAWYHAVVAYGFDENFIYFRNSWSQYWGDNGNGKFGQDYLPFISVAATAVDVPDSLLDPLKVLKWIIKDGEQFVVGKDSKKYHIYNLATLTALRALGVITGDAPVPDVGEMESGQELVILTQE